MEKLVCFLRKISVAGDCLYLETVAEHVKNRMHKVFKLEVEKKATFEQKYPFMLVSVLEGDGLLNGELVKKGDHLILPAGLGTVEVEGNLKAICSTL